MELHIATNKDDGTVYDNALNDALRQCQLLSDFDQAMARWMMASRMARKMGAPVDLIHSYEDKLLNHYEQRSQQVGSNISQLIVDNHGTINDK